MLKTSASFVLSSSKSSTGTRPPHHSAARTNLVLLIRRTVRPRGYASGFDSPADLLNSRFEHPALWKSSVLLLVVLLSQSWSPVFAQSDAEKTPLTPPQDVRAFDTPSDGGGSLTVLWSPAAYDNDAVKYQILLNEEATISEP